MSVSYGAKINPGWWQQLGEIGLKLGWILHSMSDASFPFNPMAFDRRNCSDDAIKALYTQLMLPRMIERK